MADDLHNRKLEKSEKGENSLKTRVLVLGCKDWPPFTDDGIISGGMEVYTYEICKKLSEKCDFQVLHGRVQGQKRENDIDAVDAIPLKIYGQSLGQPISLALKSLIPSILVGKKFDVINAQTPLSALVGVFCKILFKTPLVVTVHTFGSQKSRTGNSLLAFVYYVIERIVLKRAEKIITAGKVLQDYLTDLHKLPESKFTVIHAGTDSLNDPGMEEEEKELPRGDGDFLVAYVGRLIYENGVQDLLEAFKIVRDRGFTGIQLVLAGNGEDEKGLKDFVRKEGLEDKVSFLGVVTGEKKGELLGRMNLLARTSYHEVYPVVFLEAFSYGKAVLATPVGDNEIIAEESGGILIVPVNSPEKIADALLEGWKNPEKIAHMGRKGKRYSQNFTWEAQGEKYHEVLNEAIRKGTR